jgi:hypothetical protein
MKICQRFGNVRKKNDITEGREISWNFSFVLAVTL